MAKVEKVEQFFVGRVGGGSRLGRLGDLPHLPHPQTLVRDHTRVWGAIRPSH